MSSQPDSSDRSSGENSAQTLENLVAEIKHTVEAGDFQIAERLREKLIETYPMAISEAIGSAEMIETAMTAALDREHLELWSDLYDQLTDEERNCLYHSLQKYNLPEKRMLLKYGSLNNRLFFLEQGTVTVAVPQGKNKYQVLAQLGRGDVLGEYSFATIALCSATAVAKSPVQIRCLEGRIAESWEEKHPGLYDKILAFCQKYGRIDRISARQEQEQHNHPRYPMQGRVKATLLDKNGRPTKVLFNGDMEEISRSGTSFSIHCNQRSTVKKLLTRSFDLSFSCSTVGRELTFSTVGRVVRVSFLLYNDYLLHIGFHTYLPEDLEKQLSA